MDSIREKVFAAFEKEHKALLSAIRKGIHLLKTKDTVAQKDLETVRRSAHTLKGAARAAGLEFVQNAARCLEICFSAMKTGKKKPKHEVIRDMDRLISMIEAYVTAFAGDPMTPVPGEATTVMSALTDEWGRTKVSFDRPKEAKASTPPESADESGLSAKVLAAFKNEYKPHLETIRRVLDTISTDAVPAGADLDNAFRSAHTLKGAARAADLPFVQDTAHGIENRFAGIRDSRTAPEPEVIQEINRRVDAVEDYVVSLDRTQKIPDDAAEGIAGRQINERVHVSDAHLDEGYIDTIRIRAERMDHIQRTAGQMASEGIRQKRVAVKINQVRQMLAEWSRNTEVNLNRISRSRTLKDKRDEMAGSRTRLVSQKEFLPKLRACVRELDLEQRAATRTYMSLSRQIQGNALKARMVPAEDVFQVFRKMMRDLSADEGKQIRFEIKGLDVQADRLVLQALKDPLMHMLRNAISHGIEPSAERAEAGKDPVGLIRFILRVRDDRLNMTIEDDGRGIDYQAILNQVVKKGHVSETDASELNRQDLLRYMYEPGFTTVKMITDLKGRGVGMSVVKGCINRLGGNINVTGEDGQGTRFDLVVPLTILSHRMLRIRSGGQTFGIPAHHIEQLIKIRLEDVESVDGTPVIRFNQSPVPFGMLKDYLEINDAKSPGPGDTLFVMVVHSEGQLMGLGVDRFLSQEDVLVKTLPPPADRIPFFSGGFMDDDGSVSLILKPEELLKRMTGSATPRIFSVKEENTALKAPARILIVDDSVTTRTLERTILESQGYKVFVAVDGMDALDLLRHQMVDLVVTDIQMPKMDGFDLIRKMKQSDTLKDLPVIIVTSMADQQDRERGMTLGADAYIVKQKFDQKNLLETIGQIL